MGCTETAAKGKNYSPRWRAVIPFVDKIYLIIPSMISKAREVLKLIIFAGTVFFTDWTKLGLDHMENDARIIWNESSILLQLNCTVLLYLENWRGLELFYNKEKLRQPTVDPSKVSHWEGPTWFGSRDILSSSSKAKMKNGCINPCKENMRRFHLVKPKQNEESRSFDRGGLSCNNFILRAWKWDREQFS